MLYCRCEGSGRAGLWVRSDAPKPTAGPHAWIADVTDRRDVNGVDLKSNCKGEGIDFEGDAAGREIPCVAAQAHRDEQGSEHP